MLVPRFPMYPFDAIKACVAAVITVQVKALNADPSIVTVAPAPDVAIPPVPKIEIAFAAGVAVPASVGKVKDVVVEAFIVTVLPDASVSTPTPPIISSILLRGIAVPTSASNVVGICGLFAISSRIPACEITTPSTH